MSSTDTEQNVLHVAGSSRFSPVALSWRDSTWNPDFEHASLGGKKLYKCFNQGWKGLKLQFVSQYELKAVRSLFPDQRKIMIIEMRYGISCAVGGEYVGKPCFEIWFATEDMLNSVRNLLSTLPVRSRWAVTNLPVDPLIKKTLRNLNHLCLQSRVQRDASDKPRSMGVISVQEFDGLDKLLAILALTL